MFTSTFSFNIKGFVMRSIRVSHIVVNSEELAKVLLENLQDIEERALLDKMFTKLAKKYSACSSRNKGGDIGFIEPLSNAPELVEAALAAHVGEVCGPVHTKYGYHIFMITQEEAMGDTGIDGIHAGTLR
ncbi:MAG: peptidylprolyl isomerase [Nitrospinota bacterium]|nr:peptidylprolyl isomerase [Nitrospinota bacterium]